MDKGRKRKLITFLLLLVMVFNPAVTFAQSNGSQPFSSVKSDLYTESLDKIEPGLMDSLSDGDYTEVIVYLKSQVDSMEVAKQAKSEFSSALTPYKKKIEVRKEVIEALKNNAEDAQKKLLKYISQEKDKNNVVEYKSYYIVNAVYVKARKDVIESIAYMDEVEKIYENKLIKLNKPQITLAAQIPASAEGVEWNVEKVKADEAWMLGIDGTGVVVGIIDTGATWNHPALKEKWRGYNPDNPDSPDPTRNWFDPVDGSTLPVDDSDVPHGTHVLGTILGQEPDGSNKIGVAPGATWIAAKAFTADGGYEDDILAAAEWMLAPGGDPTAAPDIINNSWGGDSGLDEWFRPMVNAWRAAEILPVFSAGNEEDGAAPQGSVSNPANYPECFAVGATNINNIRADFSRRGPGPYDNLKPDVSAPGVNIRSSVPGGYESGWSGTSMAAPAVSGTAALILSANNSLSVEQVENLLKETAVPLEDSEDSGYPNNGYGYGLIDAFEAVSDITGGTGVIEGKVLKEGEDLGGPVINHKQEIFETFIGSIVPVSAEVSDDVSVVEVQLFVRLNGKSYWIVLPMNRTSGDHKSGIYTGTVTSDIFEQKGFTYVIKARDYDGNVVVSDEYKVNVKFGALPDDYATDFETEPLGWLFDGEWQWGEPAKNVGPQPLSGLKLIGTNLSGNYANNSNSILVSPPLDLRNNDLKFAQFRIRHWYELENNHDKGIIYVTNDYGSTWNPVAEYTGSQTLWKEIVINLNEYIGSDNPVYIAFRLVTDSSVQKAGWYLEDAKFIATDTQAPSIPANLTGKIVFGTAALKWDPVPEGDVEGYKVYRSDSIDGDYILLGETSGTSYGDRTALPEHTYYYKVSSYDFVGNESEYTLPLALETGTAKEYVFLTDFEENDGNFTTGGTNNSWEWGEPVAGPGAGLYGNKVWATNLSGNYLNNTNAWIESPQIQLPSGKNSVLTIGHWYELENKYDKGYIQISKKDGKDWSAWVNIAPDGYFTGEEKTWRELSIPLNSSYQGQTVKFRFLLTSDSSFVKSGWYIDYIIVDTTGEVSKKIGIHKGSKEAGNSSTEKRKEKEVKPLKLNLKPKKSKNTVIRKTISDDTLRAVSSVTTGLPLDAVVTVLETGKSVRTNPADGKYSMKHVANEGNSTWTLRVEAYGYYPVETKVHLGEKQIVKKNFVLEEMPKGTITGKIFDRYSKDPIAYATVRVKEDSRIPAVTADENGEFVIPDVYEGNYTLKVMADGFDVAEVSVRVTGNETTQIQVPLKRFVGYEEEIIYDDGTAENALVLNSAGNGLAVRVTPAGFGKVKGANIYFWGSSWPNPGGNQIGITLYDTDADGNPVSLDTQPKIVNVVRGEWNYIDLSDFGFATGRDFFIATYQTAAGTSSPGTGIDEASPYGDRSYLYVGNNFTPLEDAGVGGGLMIRARMEYSVDTPAITNLKDVNYTNQDSILVEGTVTADGKVNFYVNGVKSDVTDTINKTFSKEITLSEDESIITVTSEVNGKETEPSEGKTVIKDKTAPELSITEPADGLITKERVVDIIGTVSDEHFDRLEVDEEAVEVADGSFHIEKIVHKGENTFRVKAYDLAGNITEKSVTVIMKNDLPEIIDLEPSEDVTLLPGEELMVSFTAEPGGNAAFRIILPGSINAKANGKVSMEEVSDGFYVGTWTAPEAEVKGLIVEVEFSDKAGNKVTALAEGKVNITAEPSINNLEPSEDVTLAGGEELTVSFYSKEGGKANFRLVFPGLYTIMNTKNNMNEVSPGYYVGTWTAPYNTKVSGLVVEVNYTDAAGKTITATAAGKVNIAESKSEESVVIPMIPKTSEIPEVTEKIKVPGTTEEIDISETTEVKKSIIQVP